VSSEILFPSSGRPRATVTSSANHYQTGIESVMTAGDVNISFEFEIVQTQVPPVAVTQIPFTFQAAVSVSAADNGGIGMAHAIFDLVSTEHAGVYFAKIVKNFNDVPPHDSFDIDRPELAILGEVFHVNLLAQAEASTIGPAP
jgi:hypothetical protein